MNRLAGNVIPIPGPDRPGRVYLEVVADFDRQRAIVRPGTSGGRLPPFWDVWLRSAVLELTPSNATVEVRIVGKFVYVKSPQGYPLALHLAQTAARRIYGFPELPLIRARRYRGERYEFSWRLRDGQVRLTHDLDGRPNRTKYRSDVGRLAAKLEGVARAIPLPVGCRLHIDYADPASLEDTATYISLTIPRSVRHRSADLRKLVELRFALALTPHRAIRQEA